MRIPYMAHKHAHVCVCVLYPQPIGGCQKGTQWAQNMFMHIVGTHKSPDRRDAMNGRTYRIPFNSISHVRMRQTFGPKPYLPRDESTTGTLCSQRTNPKAIHCPKNGVAFRWFTAHTSHFYGQTQAHAHTHRPPAFSYSQGQCELHLE